MATQNKSPIKSEKWKTGRYAVVRDKKGRFLAKTPLKGKSIHKLNEIYIKNNTFNINIRKQKLTNVTEYTKTIKQVNLNNFLNQKPFSKQIKTNKRFAMYEVSGKVGLKTVYARSQRVGHPEALPNMRTSSKEDNIKEAIKTAWENFARRVSQVLNSNNYEVDLKAIEDNVDKSSIREGWVYYV